MPLFNVSRAAPTGCERRIAYPVRHGRRSRPARSRDPSRRPGRTPSDRGQPLARRRTGVEKVIRVKRRRRDGETPLPRRASSASSTSTRGRPASTCRASRRSSTRRSTRSSSARRCAPRSLAAHIAERVRERQGGLRAEVTITARYPETVHDPGLRPPDPGDLHPLRHRGRLRARHPHADRRRGPGHDRLPLRAGDGRRPRPRAARRARLRRRRRSSASLEAVPVATHNQRGIGTLHIGCPEGGEPGSTPASCCASSRAR